MRKLPEALPALLALAIFAQALWPEAPPSLFVRWLESGGFSKNSSIAVEMAILAVLAFGQFWILRKRRS